MRHTTRQRISLMRYYSERGHTLWYILPAIGIGRSAAIKLARRAGLEFSDYKPRKKKA